MATTLTIGTTRVVALSDRRHRFDYSWHYPSVPAEAWEPYADMLTDDTYAMLNFGAFLILADGRTVLVDTGWGPYMGPPGDQATEANLLRELAEIGLSVGDIDVVAFTHLHPDHVGWNLDLDGEVPRPRFYAARYLVPELDWKHYSSLQEMHPNIRAQALPLGDLGVIDLFGDGHAIAPSVTAVATPGHTPGHTSFMVSSAGETLCVLGDLAHHPVILSEPDWVQRFDWEPEQAVLTRKQMFERLEAEGTVVAAGHFRYPSVGRIVREDGRRKWKPL